MRSFEYQLFADYFQFQLHDEAASGDLSESWSKEAVARLLAVAPGVVGIGTVRNMEVPVSLEVHASPPSPDFDEWDQVIECSLDVPSGRIVVGGVTDYFPDVPRVDVDPGTYRLRVSHGSLGTVSEDGLDGEDQYRIQLWLASTAEMAVLKARAS